MQNSGLLEKYKPHRNNQRQFSCLLKFNIKKQTAQNYPRIA